MGHVWEVKKIYEYISHCLYYTLAEVHFYIVQVLIPSVLADCTSASLNYFHTTLKLMAADMVSKKHLAQRQQ